MSMIAKNRVKSTWTPLSNQETNSQIFEERRVLVGNWFDKWNDSQRRRVLEDILSKCKIRQIEFAGNIVNQKKPVFHEDFTRCLPRVLSMYIFSFLDPRSLCRCSQVCWYWKFLTELDQLWLAKCVRLGWVLSFTPNPYETGVWKRNYIENIMALQCLRPSHEAEPPIGEMEKLRLELESRRGTPRPGSARRPPWRGSDPTPKDTWRNNILDNDDEIDKVSKLRKKGTYGPESDEWTKKARSKVNVGRNVHNSARKQKPKYPGMNGFMGERPEWAKSTPEISATPLTPTHAPSARGDAGGHSFRPVSARKDRLNQQNSTAKDVRPSTEVCVRPTVSLDASIRPAPVIKTTVVKTTPNRSARDPPSHELFPEPAKSAPDIRNDSLT